MKISILTMEFKCIFIVFRIFKKIFDSFIYVCDNFEFCFIPGTRSHPFNVFFYPVTRSPPPPVVALLLPNRPPSMFMSLLYVGPLSSVGWPIRAQEGYGREHGQFISAYSCFL